MPLPKLMKIVDAPLPGGPEALVVLERPLPECGDEEALIKIAAAGVNRADILQRRGLYKVPAGAPAHPGLEVSGTIAAVGSRVTDLRVGDAVCALLQGGGYSEYCSVNVGQTLPIPGSLDMIEAAALPEAYFTVWSNVFEFGRLRAGERLLVHGGSSGIGSATIQLAAARGSVVYATAGSDEKCRFCEQLGATRAINYRSEDFVTAIADATSRQGVDVVLDMVGGSYLSRNLQVLAPEGRLVIIATQGGSKAELDIARIMQHRIFVTGSLLRPRPVEFKRDIKSKLLEHVWPLLASGRIKPIVDKVFPLAEAGRAQAYMESSAHKGKIVLAVASAQR